MTSRELIAAEASNTDRIVLYREGLFWKAYERSAYALCTQVRAFRPTRKVLKALGGGDIVSVGFPAIAADRILAGLSRLDLPAADSDASDVPAAVAAVDSSVTCISGASSAADATGSDASSAARASVAAGSVSVGTDACAAGSVANASAGSCAAPRASSDTRRPSAACMADIAASPTRMVFAAPQPIVESDFRAWKSALPISLSIPRPAAADTSSCDETSAAELPLHGRPFDGAACAEASNGVSDDALRPASGRAAAADLAASAGSGAAAGLGSVAVDADFAVRPAQPRLWTRLGDWLVRWATGADSSSPRAVADIADSACSARGADAAGSFAGSVGADASPVAADTASPVGTAASAERILGALRKFEVADKTPMECMMFIAELKKQLL